MIYPTFSRLLLGPLGNCRHKVASPKRFTPYDPLSHLLLAHTVLGEGIALCLHNVTQETDEVLGIIRAYLREQGAFFWRPVLCVLTLEVNA